MLRDFQHWRQLWRISRVLARHDALFFLEMLHLSPVFIALAKRMSRRGVQGRPGERLSAAFQELGPTFIKFGQALSVRPDVIGDEIAQDLNHLQDRLPPFSAREARAIIKNEFGVSVEELFKEFEDKPVAAASIAQVHFAIDAEGNKVAVKVLRPGVEDVFKRDVTLFYWLAAMASRTMPRLKRLRLREVVDTYAAVMKTELDLRLEAAAASELRENFAKDEGVIIPAVDWQRTSRQVLTLERISGVRIDDRDALIKEGHDVDAIVKAAAEMFFKQVFRDGFFHADMHPGNFFVAKDGAVIAVDFGITGRLDRQTRIFLAEMLLGFLQRDYTKVSEVHFAAGYIPSDQSVEGFAQAARSIGEPIFGRPSNEISLAELLAQLFKISADFEMETQPQLLLLQKTMLYAEGIGRMLNPEINFWELSRPLVEEWAKNNLGPQAKVKDAVEEVRLLGQRLHNVVQAADHLPQIITKDGVKLHPDTLRGMRRKQGFDWWKLVLLAGIVLLVLVLAS